MNTQNPATVKTKGAKPAYQLYLVIDQPGKPAAWIDMGGLWATKNGTGFTSKLQSPLCIPPGARLVMMPPKADAPPAVTGAA